MKRVAEGTGWHSEGRGGKMDSGERCKTVPPRGAYQISDQPG